MLFRSLWRDELFLPMVLVGEVDPLDQAITRANASDYGLTAGFYGARDEIDTFLGRIEAGVTYVNRPQGATTGAAFRTYLGPDAGSHAAHSIYFQVLGDNGFIGLGIFLAILGLLQWHCVKIMRGASHESGRRKAQPPSSWFDGRRRSRTAARPPP